MFSFPKFYLINLSMEGQHNVCLTFKFRHAGSPGLCSKFHPWTYNTSNSRISRNSQNSTIQTLTSFTLQKLYNSFQQIFNSASPFLILFFPFLFFCLIFCIICSRTNHSTWAFTFPHFLIIGYICKCLCPSGLSQKFNFGRITFPHNTWNPFRANLPSNKKNTENINVKF